MALFNNPLKNRVAIVTGGTKGIGKGIADKLASLGAKVIVCARNKEKTKHHLVLCDVSNLNHVQSLIAEVIKKYKKVDILVNNAGIYPNVPFKDMTEEQWDQVINTNLKSMFIVTRAVLPYMTAQGKGSIINLSSIAGTSKGYEGSVHYCASKAGVLGFTRATAVEFAKLGIRVNAIAPGLILTPGVTSAIDEKGINDFIQTVPLKRAGLPKDIGEAAAFLATDASSYITGQVIIVDGGNTVL